MNKARHIGGARDLSRAATAVALYLFAAGSAAREVMSWVPPYGIEESKAVLTARFGAASPSNSLTRLGLQFWLPAPGGGLVTATNFSAVTASNIAWFADWGDAHGVETLLCVYNNPTGTWDWALAKQAFATHRATFVGHLVSAMETHRLDGIDIDLEGKVTPTDADRESFREFLSALSAELKPRGKTLTVDSFHSPIFNAPNMSWWADWTNLVDAVHSMGYEDLYEGNTATHPQVEGRLYTYSWQQAYGVNTAGLPPEAVSMGLPGETNRWGSGGRGETVLDHLRECVYDCATPASVCIWDIRLRGATGPGNWRSPEVWDLLHTLSRYETVPTDADGDGIADLWERRHFGSLDVCSGDPRSDGDRDGSSDRTEYLAGTDPTNRFDFPRIKIAERAGDQIVLRAETRAVDGFDPEYGDATRLYRFEVAPTAGGSETNWTAIPDWPEFEGDGAPLFATNRVKETEGYFRVRVRLISDSIAE
jgi:hypothetical protein